MRFIHQQKSIVAASLLGSLILCGAGAKEGGKPATDQIDGEALARQYCTTCHVYTEPDLLTKQSWEFLLTYMGFFYGVVDYRYLDGSSERTMDIIRAREGFVRDAGLVPDQAVLTDAQWKAIRTFFVSNAPEKAIPQVAKPPLLEDLGFFKPKPAQYRAVNAITSLVAIDEQNGFLMVHDSRGERLTILDRDLDFHDGHDAPGVFLIDAKFDGNELYLLNIGDLFAAHIGKSYGEVQYAKTLGGVFFGLKILLKDLHRPSDFSFGDFDNDGVDELLVSNFGDYTGNLSLFQKEERSASYDTTPQFITNEPGIVASRVHDFNDDGLLDIAVLMSAARENLSIFVNDGAGGFVRNIIVESHPSFGYTGLEIRDFNNDGRMDLITLNGDNGDSDPYNTLKRDQGIRIYLNQEELQFTESYFYPMYGAYKTEIEDFDLDGDLDIAAIAFFPDFYPDKPENFVLLEQIAAMEFSPRTHPATYNGRWLTMDSGDLDDDGDKDLVLGAAYSPVGMMANHEERFLKLVNEGPALLYLENLSR
jgi:hypothetical protein